VITRSARAAACTIVLCCGCSPVPRASARPNAEFLLVSDDSTAWVHSSADTVVVQRAPLLVATLDGRLIEIFVADEPINFENATFLVSRLFRRDLVSGDSTLVYADSTVLREVMAFVRAHPDAERLDADEPEADDVRAFESSITALDVIGGTIGVEVHLDRTVGELGTHDTYRATVALHTGKRLALADVVSPASARATLHTARQRLTAAIAVAGDSAGPVGRAASRALATLHFDSLSFSLARRGDSLAVEFLAHDEQVIDEARDSHRFALQPISLVAPTWWPAARRVLPAQQADSSARFDVGDVLLDVTYDSQDVAQVVTRTTSGTRVVTRMRGPVRRAIAVGDSLIAPVGQWRRSLERAFSESGYYSEQVRAASLRVRARPTAARQAAL
jgi:hypothetical protein